MSKTITVTTTISNPIVRAGEEVTVEKTKRISDLIAAGRLIEVEGVTESEDIDDG